MGKKKEEEVGRHRAASWVSDLAPPNSPLHTPTRGPRQTHPPPGCSAPGGLSLTCGKICSWSRSHTGLQRKAARTELLTTWKSSHHALRGSLMRVQSFEVYRETTPPLKEKLGVSVAPPTQAARATCLVHSALFATLGSKA